MTGLTRRVRRWSVLGALALILAVLCIVAADARARQSPSPSPSPVPTPPATLRPGGTPASGGLLLLSGSLHDHSTDSDGDSSSRVVIAWEFNHRAELGLDFGGLSDHSDFWPFAYRVPFGGSAWRRQARMVQQYAGSGFAFVRSFEYTSDQENHVSVIGSADYLDGIHSSDLTMTPFYRWLAARPTAIAQFNHPSTKGALQWDNLAFVPAVAGNFSTIEIHGDQGFTPRDLARSDAGWYWLALTRGWTVGPTMDWDTHEWHQVFRQKDLGTRCGEPHTLPCQRTLVLADADSTDAILRAIRARRTTATEHPSLWATLRGPDGIWQGSTFGNAAPGTALDLTVEAGSTIWPLDRVDIVSDNGIDPHPYYDADNAVKIKRSSLFADSFREQHQRFVRSGGHAVRKAVIDEPPEGTTVASVPLSGNHAIQTIVVTIPNVPSLRPDHRHFYYAVVHAGQVRAWTAPIFADPSAQHAEVTNAAPSPH